MESFDWLYVFYLSEFSNLFMVLIYLPVLVVTGRAIYQRLSWPTRLKLPAIICGVILLYFAPIADVVVTGVKMHNYCKYEHGEHIYKTGTANSLYGESLGSARNYIEAGFEFIETPGIHNKLTRFELYGDEIIRTLIDVPVSEFELVEEIIILGHNIEMRNARIENQFTREVYGETKNFTAYDGWLDRITPSLGPQIKGCNKPRAFASYPFVLKFIKPNKGLSP